MRIPKPTAEHLERASLTGDAEVIARALARTFSLKALRNMQFAISSRASEAQERARHLGFGNEKGNAVFATAEELRLSARIYDRARVLKEYPAGEELL